jgi:hypothetical protein
LPSDGGNQEVIRSRFSAKKGALCSEGTMIRERVKDEQSGVEPAAGRPESAGEEWLGRNRSAGRRLWERLNPRSRQQLRVLAEALALEQTRARLPDEMRGRLGAAMAELERIVLRVRSLLAEVARRTPPAS